MIPRASKTILLVYKDTTIKSNILIYKIIVFLAIFLLSVENSFIIL